MATSRRDFAGTGRTFLNGSMMSEAGETKVSVGGNLERVVTQGFTGETMSDPTKVEVSIDGAVLKRESFVARLRALQASQQDCTLKVQIGTNVMIARGKIGMLEFGTQNGKSTFSAKFMGDEQR